MNKKIGRAPPDWTYTFLDLDFGEQFVSRDRIADALGISIDTFRKKLSRLQKQPRCYLFRLPSGQKTFKYEIKEIRAIIMEHVKDWHDKDY